MKTTMLLMVILAMVLFGCYAKVDTVSQQPAVQPNPQEEAVVGDTPPPPGAVPAGCDPAFAKCM